MQEVGRGAVQDAVHCAEQGRECLVVETNNHAGRGQISRVGLLPASANRNKSLSLFTEGFP